MSSAYALNKRAYNTAIMAGAQTGGDCQLDWVTQSEYQFDMMIDNAMLNMNFDDALAYEGENVYEQCVACHKSGYMVFLLWLKEFQKWSKIPV